MGRPDRREIITGLIGALAMLLALVIFHVTRSEPGHCRPDHPITIVGGEDVSAAVQRRAMITKWPGSGRFRLAAYRELTGVADYQHSEMVATARSGGCPADIYLIDAPWVAEFAAGDFIDPVDESKIGLAPLYQHVRDAGRYRGRLWAVPFNTDAPLLYYRTDLVGPADVPTRWEDLKNKAVALARAPANRLDGGYATQLDEYEGLTVNLLELVRTHRGDIGTGGGESVAVDRKALLGALSDLLGLAGDRPLIAASSIRAKERETIEAFRDRRVAFMRNWPYAYGVLAGEKEMKGKFGVAAFPGAKVLGGQSLSVAAGLPEDRRAAAYDLIEHLTGKSQQQFLFSCGGFAPVRPDAYEPVDTARCPADTQGTSNKKVTLHPDGAIVDRAIRQAAPRPVTPYYPQFSRTLQTRLHDYLECVKERRSCPGAGAVADALIKELDRAARGD